MRENTKWIMLVTALAFVALMVFEWGMDITGRSSGGLGEIGRVNGDAVMYEEYIATYRNLYDERQRQQEGQPLTSSQSRELEDEAFNQVVTRLLVSQELERRGIEVTDEEIREAALYAPPPALQSDPTFLTNGVFDLAKYQSFIRSPQVDEQTLLYLESYYRDVLPRGKLLRQLTSGVYPSDQELWRAFQEQTETVVVRYISLEPTTRVPDAQVSVTEREVREYYNANQDNFQRPAQADVRVVTLSKTPLPSDSAAARERALSIRQELLGGADFAEVARRESADTQSGPAGGVVGTIGRNQVAPEFEEAAFAAPVGQVTAPVQTAYGYHLIKVQSRTADSATVSHILVSIERAEESELRLLARADSLERLSERQGLDAAAQTLGVQVMDQRLQALFPFVAGIGQAAEGADWAMEEAAPGEVSPLFETPEAFYVMELKSATPAGVQTFDDARGTIEQVLKAQKKTALALEEGRGLVARIRAGQTLDAVASAQGFQPQTVGPFNRLEFVPNLGYQNAAIGVAFGLRPGQVSDPVAAASNVYILEQVSRTPADSTAWIAQTAQQRQQLGSMAQQRRMDEWLQEVRATARIVDRREQVLQPVTEEEPARGVPGPFGRPR